MLGCVQLVRLRRKENETITSMRHYVRQSLLQNLMQHQINAEKKQLALRCLMNIERFYRVFKWDSPGLEILPIRFCQEITSPSNDRFQGEEINDAVGLVLFTQISIQIGLECCIEGLLQTVFMPSESNSVL